MFSLANTDTISGAVNTATGGFADQLWLIVPAALAVGLGIMWGVPKGKQFVKKLAG